MSKPDSACFPVWNRHNNCPAIPDSKDKLKVVERGNAEIKLAYVISLLLSDTVSPLTKQAHWDSADPMIGLCGVQELPDQNH